MADRDHSTLTDVDGLHEPKGALTASANEVYVADGAASGAWTALYDVLTLDIEDIDTAGSWFVVAPNAGDITTIYTVVHTSITSDNTITAEIAGAAVTGSSITITASGSAAGDVDSSSPSANNTVTAGQAIEIISDGAAANACRATVTVVIGR